MTTPEGKIKAKLNRRLKEIPNLWKYMPVSASAFGMASLDYILCIKGYFVAIETKAPGKKLTMRQEVTRDIICEAGGAVFVVDSMDAVDKVIDDIKWIYLQKSQ